MIDAQDLRALVREHRIPLVFLEACQSAAEERPTASVAAKLLDAGVTSVVAMTHSVLVETSRRFATAFYAELVRGARIGTAMLAGQNALYGDDFRGQVMGAGDLRLKDWFVPVLYQEENDPRLVTRLLPEAVQRLQEQRRRLSLGALPDPPAHTFVGRSRDLLKLERMLSAGVHNYTVIRGRGGEGKTTLAIELARWLVQTGRFDRAAFVSLERYSDARGVLDALGRQVLPEGDNWSVAKFADIKEARLEVERALRDNRTIILLDNVESLFLDPNVTGSTGGVAHEAAGDVKEIFDLCESLLHASQTTRVIFTSRESLPRPLSRPDRTVELRELDPNDAVELVSNVMKLEGRTPKGDDAGNTPQEIVDLVEAVGCHARALTLLAREIAVQGVRATTENVHRLMAELDHKHPGDRENSLYASVELSLRRLPPAIREQVQALGVFKGGGQVQMMQRVLDVDEGTAADIGRSLVEVGLAEWGSHGYLALDPGLPSHLSRALSPSKHIAIQRRWAEAMVALTRFLYQQTFLHPELSAQLTVMELPNLMALLDWLQESAAPEQSLDVAIEMEALLAKLGRQRASARATFAREQAARRLNPGGDWTYARFNAEIAALERLLESGPLSAGLAAAQRLLERSEAAGSDAYEGATYNTAMAHLMVGRVMRMTGAPEAGLAPLREARRRLKLLADGGDTRAARMASAAVADMADCLCDLRRLDEAASAYNEAIRSAVALGDRRGAAVSKGQLGTVRLLQRRYEDALRAYSEARTSFEAIGEPRTVATYWHQAGAAYREAGQFEHAESAYRQALALKVQLKDVAGEASSLTELGNLYHAIGRLEEAVMCSQQAAAICVRLGDRRHEGSVRNNLAGTLLKLGRLHEARSELMSAIECKELCGPTTEPWTTWELLRGLEEVSGDVEAAAVARDRAFNSYLSYRRGGGQSYDWGAEACRAVAQALRQGEHSAIAAVGQQLRRDLPVPEANADSRSQALVSSLIAILSGTRTPSLAQDPEMLFADAVELTLLLESLAGK